MSNHPETITVDDLRKLATRRGPLAKLARDLLPSAEDLERRGQLASILIDRHLRDLKIFRVEESTRLCRS